MEDVPIYFLGIPEGFFPINMGPKSGDRKSTRLNSSHMPKSRMPSSA